MKTQAALVFILVTSSLSEAWADEYSDVCGDTTTLQGQKANYCTAAKQAKDATKKEKTLTMLYAAVSGTCIAACTTQIISAGTSDFICQSSALGAAATDMVMTKNLMNGVNALVGGLGVADAFGNIGKATSATTNIGKKEIKNCWITAATSGASAFAHKMGASNSNATYEQNLASAKQVVDSNSSPTFTATFDSGTSASTATKIGAATSTATSLSNGGSAAAGNTACNDTSSVSGAIACAATADSNLAGRVSNPEFQKAFEKTSGMKLADFLKGAGNVSPNDAIKAAAGGALPADMATKLDGALTALQNSAPNFNTEANATYASGGHGGNSASADPDLAAMMNGLMNQLKPKSPEEKKNEVTEVKFSGPRRSLASVTAEDPTVSLFDRVAFRYSNIIPKWLADPRQQTLKGWSPSNPKDSAIKRN